jgi:hypothetical protein
MLSANVIVELHDQLTTRWHETRRNESQAVEAGPDAPGDWLQAVASQHRANFDLWHIEDEARTPHATAATIAGVKRRIDRTNQLRNDLAEVLDRALLAWLEPQGLPDSNTSLNSESPGLIIDRLSILALKIYHTREEVDRENAPARHAELNRDRLNILGEQRRDLAHCLDALWRDTLDRKRRFKLYRQMKMYNHPELNPAIYTKKRG